jgi:cell division protein DivIC
MANPLKPLIDQLPAPFRNKYFLVLILFVGWLVFFDKHQVLTQWDLHQTLQNLEEEKAFYEEKIEEAWEDKQDIEVNREKFAREKYYLKKKDEDVFVIREK